jgi:hypothetical protein
VNSDVKTLYLHLEFVEGQNKKQFKTIQLRIKAKTPEKNI